MKLNQITLIALPLLLFGLFDSAQAQSKTETKTQAHTQAHTQAQTQNLDELSDGASLHQQDSRDAHEGSCLTSDGAIPNGSSVVAFAEATPSKGSRCLGEIQICTDGTLEGTFTALNCDESGAIAAH